jgi:FMN-binding protein
MVTSAGVTSEVSRKRRWPLRPSPSITLNFRCDPSRLIVFVLLAALPAQGRVLQTQQQALTGAFARGARVVRETTFLTPAQIKSAKQESGVDFRDRLIIRYTAFDGTRIVGYAYFDTHRVRTLSETVMIVVTPEGRIEKVEVLSFDEPPDYLPKKRWLDQLIGQKLDADLSLARAVRPMSGASLTGRAIVNASRKILALHRVIGGATPK